MSCDLESALDGWDRIFLDLSSICAEPFCAAWNLLAFRLVAPIDPQKFENSTSKVKEIATRVLIVLGAVLGGFLVYAMPVPMLCTIGVLAVGCKVFRAIGFALQKKGFTHVRGTAPEKVLNPQDPQVKVMSWNICGIGGGMSIDHGGVINWRSRLDGILHKIKTENPDVLILQEVYDTALSEALIARLQSEYAHFFTHLGANVLGSVGGCMVLSKCAVHDFSNTSFTNNKWTLNRGFATLELKANPLDALPCMRVIGTHLIHGDDPIDIVNRKAQVEQIVNSLAHKKLAMLTVLAGDLNIERDQAEGKILTPHLDHAYVASEPTCTNRLVAQWDAKARSVWGETIDYISIFKNTFQSTAVNANIELKDCHIVEAFDGSYNTKTALSDHHGISLVIKKMSQARSL